MPRQPYPLKDGTNAPGVTTIVGQLGKGESLMNWAHRIGWEATLDWIKEEFQKPHPVGELKLPDYEEIEHWTARRDSAGAKGTDVHKLIMDFLSGEEIIIPGDRITKRCFQKFLKWWGKQKELHNMTLIIEKPMVSEILRCGGTPDIWVVEIKRRIDIKTGGKWIYDDWWYQLAGYDLLGEENDQKAEEHQILWLPKDNQFDAPIRTELEREKRIFRHLLAIYKERNDKG